MNTTNNNNKQTTIQLSARHSTHADLLATRGL